MTSAIAALEQARRSFADQARADAHAMLQAADDRGLLEAEDLERLSGQNDRAPRPRRAYASAGAISHRAESGPAWPSVAQSASKTS